MNREEIDKLIGGYATDTLTPEERQALFAAALEDQELFGVLMAEQPLKELLDDRETRGYLLAVLDEQDAMAADREGQDRSKLAPITVELPVVAASATASERVSWWQRPVTWALTASAAVVIGVSALLLPTQKPFIEPTAPAIALNRPAPPPSETSPGSASLPNDAAPRPEPADSLAKRIQSLPAKPVAPEANKQDRDEGTIKAKKAAAPAPALTLPPAPPPAAAVRETDRLAADRKKEEVAAERRPGNTTETVTVEPPASVPLAESPAVPADSAKSLYYQRFKDASGKLKPASPVQAQSGALVAPGSSPVLSRAKAAAAPSAGFYPGVEVRLLKRSPSGAYEPADAAQTFSLTDSLQLAMQANQAGYLYLTQRTPGGGVTRLFTFGPLAAYSNVQTDLPGSGETLSLLIVQSASPLSDAELTKAAANPAAQPAMRSASRDGLFSVQRKPRTAQPIAVPLEIRRQ